MKTILVFKTSVENEWSIHQLTPYLNRLINKSGQWNFDLEDCDNILRVETQSTEASAVAALLHSNGFSCEELL